YNDSDVDGEEKAEVDGLHKLYASYKTNRSGVRDALRRGDKARAKELNAATVALFAQLVERTDALKALTRADAKRLSEEVTATYSSSRTVTIAALLLAIALGCAVSY